MEQNIEITSKRLFSLKHIGACSAKSRGSSFIMLKVTAIGVLVLPNVGLRNASDSVSYKFAKGDFRIRLVAYLAMRTTSRAPVPCSAFVRLISIARFDWKVLYIRMTCRWLISSYAKLRRHVGYRSRRTRRKRGEERASIGSVPDACREEKSTRLEVTINLLAVVDCRVRS